MILSTTVVSTCSSRRERAEAVKTAGNTNLAKVLTLAPNEEWQLVPQASREDLSGAFHEDSAAEFHEVRR